MQQRVREEPVDKCQESGALNLTWIGIPDSQTIRVSVRVSAAAVFIAEPLRFTLEREGIGVLPDSV